MKSVFCITGICLLAACGGDGDGSDMGILSSGILQDIEVPSTADLADTPAGVQALVADFRDLNENNLPTDTLPGGTGDYTGTYGVGLDGEDNDTVIVGDMALTANFGGRTITGSVDNLSGRSDGEDFTLSNDLHVNMTIDDSDSTVSGTIAGTVELDAEDYDINGTLDGGFGGDDGEVLLGVTEGSIDNPDGSNDEFSGYWATEG